MVAIAHVPRFCVPVCRLGPGRYELDENAICTDDRTISVRTWEHVYEDHMEEDRCSPPEFVEHVDYGVWTEAWLMRFPGEDKPSYWLLGDESFGCDGEHGGEITSL